MTVGVNNIPGILPLPCTTKATSNSRGIRRWCWKDAGKRAWMWSVFAEVEKRVSESFQQFPAVSIRDDSKYFTVLEQFLSWKGKGIIHRILTSFGFQKIWTGSARPSTTLQNFSNFQSFQLDLYSWIFHSSRINLKRNKIRGKKGKTTTGAFDSVSWVIGPRSYLKDLDKGQCPLWPVFVSFPGSAFSHGESHAPSPISPPDTKKIGKGSPLYPPPSLSLLSPWGREWNILSPLSLSLPDVPHDLWGRRSYVYRSHSTTLV